MYYNEMDLKVYYEMKRQEMEKEISANRSLKAKKQTSFYTSFLNALHKLQQRKKSVVPKPSCCQEVCC
jgi:hypothetical protein